MCRRWTVSCGLLESLIQALRRRCCRPGLLLTATKTACSHTHSWPIVETVIGTSFNLTKLLTAIVELEAMLRKLTRAVLTRPVSIASYTG